MLKAFLNSCGKVVVVAVEGTVSAVCGCGGRNPKDYSFVKQIADIVPQSSADVAPQPSYDCSGTRVKMHPVVERFSETRHAKPLLRKHHRQTIRRSSV